MALKKREKYMFIKLTKTDGSPVWLNPEFIVRIESWKKGSAVAVAGDGDFEVLEVPGAILAMSGAPVKSSAPAVKPPAPPPAPVVNPPAPPVVQVPVVEPPVVSMPDAEVKTPKRKPRTRRKPEAKEEVAAETSAPEATPAAKEEPAPTLTPAPSEGIFPQEPDPVAVAAAILKKNRCRSRKRIQNTIKSMNPKMSMADAQAMLEQMEARGLVVIDAQGHATFL